jgi:hypothetical protein
VGAGVEGGGRGTSGLVLLVGHCNGDVVGGGVEVGLEVVWL